MPFGNKARNVRAYEFGCLPPIEGELKAIEVMRQRTNLWNQLVELHNRYIENREKILESHIPISNKYLCPDCSNEFKVMDLNSEDLKERNKCPTCKSYIKNYKNQRKTLFKIEVVKTVLDLLKKQEYEEHKNIYHNSGLYWGNYLDITNSWQVAKNRPGNLNTHSSRDGGKVHVQWPTGMNIMDAFDHTSNVLRLNPVPAEAYESPIRSIRRKAQRSVVSIRIASTEKKKPIWLTLPCVLHRPLPKNGLIRAADVLRERVATHWRWKLVIFVETSPDNVPTIPKKSGLIAIKIGWTKKENGLRVCYWSDEDGNQGELLLSNYFVLGMGRVDSIRSKRDLDFNQIRDRLVEWKKKNNSLPEWFKERTKTLSQWKSTVKLASMVVFWQKNRFVGDEDIFQAVESWRREDKHHYEYEANLRDRLMRQRRELYRVFAKNIVNNYSKVIMENYDLRPLVKRTKKGGKADELPKEARHDRVLASVSRLRMIIKNACKRENVIITEKDTTNTVRTCCICGSVDFDYKPGKSKFICMNCRKVLGVKIVLDKDYNATQNLLSNDSNNIK